MTTALFQVPDVPAALKTFGVQDAAIAKMAEQYMPLVIDGVNEKVRVALKADAVKFGKAVDSEAKRIFALLEPIETHLVTEEQRIEAEVQAIRFAKQRAEEEKKRQEEEAERARIKAEMDAAHAKLAAERKAFQEQQAAMESARKQQEAELAERQRIAREEQARIDAEQRKLEEAKKAHEAERKRLTEEEAARLRKIEEDQLKKDRAEQARIVHALDATADKPAPCTSFGADPDCRPEPEHPWDNRGWQPEEKPLAPEVKAMTADPSPLLQEDREAIMQIVRDMNNTNKLPMPHMRTPEGFLAMARVNVILDRAASEIRNEALLLVSTALPPVEDSNSLPF